MNEDIKEESGTLVPDQETVQTELPSSSETQKGSPDYHRSDADRNFAELRRQHQRAIQEREELQRKLLQYEAAKVPDADDVEIGDEDLAEGKHLKKFERKQKKLEAELQELKQKTAQELIDGRVRSRFPDFDSVVNEDSIRMLAEEDPELAYTIHSSSDGYNRAALIYKEIKKRGISLNTSYDSDKKRAHENAAKPKPLVSVSPQQGDSPLSNANAFANGLTPELQKNLWKETQKYRQEY